MSTKCHRSVRSILEYRDTLSSIILVARLGSESNRSLYHFACDLTEDTVNTANEDQTEDISVTIFLRCRAFPKGQFSYKLQTLP